MPPSAEDYLKQAEDILRWADDCDAVAKQLRARAADLLKLADPRFTAAMDRARSLDAEGNPACMKLVREIKNLISEIVFVRMTPRRSRCREPDERADVKSNFHD